MSSPQERSTLAMRRGSRRTLTRATALRLALASCSELHDQCEQRTDHVCHSADIKVDGLVECLGRSEHHCSNTIGCRRLRVRYDGRTPSARRSVSYTPQLQHVAEIVGGAPRARLTLHIGHAGRVKFHRLVERRCALEHGCARTTQRTDVEWTTPSEGFEQLGNTQP